ncbi:hypothetical protein [Thermocatellispora tengchongensis]
MFPCVLTVTALALTACTSTGTPSEPQPGSSVASGAIGPGGPAGDGATAVETAPPATPTPATLTPEAYRVQLDAVRGPVRDALSKVASAGSLKSLESRADDAEDALNEAASTLAALTPPAEVAAQHADFVDALRGMSAGMGDLRVAVDSRSVCTASGALASLGKSGELKELQEAADALSDVGDYPSDVVSVKARAETSRRLPNGRYLRSESRNGRGNLAINNGGSRDAVVTLLRGKKRVISVYVRKKSKFTVAGVRDGKYRVYFTTGTDWDARERSFSRSCSFQRFEDSFPFKTTYTATQVRWQNWRITLHAIKGGNAQTGDVNPDDFPS